MNGPELRLRITADASQVGAEAKKAAQQLNSIGSNGGASTGSASDAVFTGSLIGQAIGQALAVVVQDMARVFKDFIREQREIFHESQTSGVSENFLRLGRMSFDRVGVDEKVFSEMVASVAKRRADAIAGDPKAIESFSALNVNPVDTTEAIIRNIGANIARQNPDANTAYAAADVMGKNSSEAMYAFRNYAGTGLDRHYWAGDWMFQKFFKSSNDIKDQLVGRSYTPREMEPISTYQVERERKAREDSLQNDERESRLKMSMLPVQERITQLMKDEEGLRRMEGGASDPVLREQIRAKRLGVASEILGSNISRTRSYRDGGDELSKIGLFIGGPADNLPELTKQQLNELRRANAQLTRLPAEIANYI
jgi:hypothetical protein